MLFIFTGGDVSKAKAEAEKRAAGYELVRFGDGGESFDHVGGYLEQRGMFAAKVALVLDRPLEDSTGKELLLEKGEELVSADALVIAIQPEVDAITKKKLPKGVKFEEFDVPVIAELPPPNVFALTDAVAEGDRKKSWILYRQLIMSGASAEEIHGALGWYARGVVLASKTRSAEEAGMKPYPYGKAKRVAAKLKPGKAEALSEQLVEMYHRARSGLGDLEDLLEVFLLQRS
jgi:DNA polymerase III delta subunit